MKFEKNKNYISYNPVTIKIVTEKAQKHNIKITDEIFANLIAQHTENFGDVKQIQVNKYKKPIFVDRGVMFSSIRIIANFLNTTKENVIRWFKDLASEGILSQVCFIGAQIRYAWNYIYSTVKNKQNGLSKKSKNNCKNKLDENKDLHACYKWKAANLQRISESLAKRGILTPRYLKGQKNDLLQAKSATTDYINIKTKKEEERRDISTTKSTRDIKENGGSESSFSCDFDFSFGENDEKEPEIEITPKDLVEKMRSIGKLPYEKEREKKKYDVPVRKISKNEIDVENEKKKFQTIKAAQYFFGNESLAILIQTMAMKGIDSVYRFFCGKTRNCSPSEILEEMRRDPYFVKERIDASLEKLIKLGA
jgi:hypothetical protein